MISQEKNVQDLEAQGYVKVETVVLYAPGVILSTKPTMDVPWREDPETTNNLCVDIDTIVKILSSIGKEPSIYGKDALCSWPIAYQKLESSCPSELFVKIDQSVLKLVTKYHGGKTYFSIHGGNWDVHFPEQEVVARPVGANHRANLQ